MLNDLGHFHSTLTNDLNFVLVLFLRRTVTTRNSSQDSNYLCSVEYTIFSDKITNQIAVLLPFFLHNSDLLVNLSVEKSNKISEREREDSA